MRRDEVPSFQEVGFILEWPSADSLVGSGERESVHRAFQSEVGREGRRRNEEDQILWATLRMA